jgi:hypothetical protein
VACCWRAARSATLALARSRLPPRSHREVFDRYESGEFPSVRAAAKAAGIVKEDPPFKQCEKAIKKHLKALTATEKRKLKEMLE